jgi:hypothetical protein
MSRKDYVALAAAIRDEYRLWDGETSGSDAVENVAKNIADALAGDNPNFDRERFLAAALS